MRKDETPQQIQVNNTNTNANTALGRVEWCRMIKSNILIISKIFPFLSKIGKCPPKTGIKVVFDIQNMLHIARTTII